MPHTRGVHLLWLAGTFAAVMAGGFAFYALAERPLLNLARGRRKPAVPEAKAVEAPARLAA